MRAERRATISPAPTRVPGGANRLRIIGGQWRSRVLRFPDSKGLRPTPDRVRETLFNWLGQRLEGLSCLDLFAGSGALGFEARSRGASRVVLVERDRNVVSQLRRTAQDLGESVVEIVQADALGWLARDPSRYDVVFVDPPYAAQLLQPALAALDGHLHAGARVYVESSTPVVAPPGRWDVLKAGRAGAVHFALLAPSGLAAALPAG